MNDVKDLNDYIMKGVKDPVLTVEPKPTFIVKSPGMPVRFADGQIINMNRATRRKNKLYGDRIKRSK